MGQIPSTPSIIPVPFATNGQKNSIPETISTPGAPDASWSVGFPSITMINKQAGGKPPLGKDFNGVLNQLSNNAFFAQSGCIYAWNNTLNYLAGSHCAGSDGHEYIALLPSGPDIPATGSGYVGAKDPTDSDNETYWLDMTYQLTHSTPTTMLCNVRDVITTSGTWTAPVTGWYKVTCIGGGGGGGAGGLGGDNIAGNGGGQGGTTSFGSAVTAVGGSGGGGGSDGATSGGGGGAGSVVIDFLYKTADSTVAITIGAGGTGGTRGAIGQTAGGNGAGPNGGIGGLSQGGGYGNGAGGAPGAGNGISHTANIAIWKFGGTGAITGYPYGCGGGGGGGGAAVWGGYLDCGGQAFGNAQKGFGYQSTLTADQYALGGHGGSGAVILEYFNPAVTA